LSTPLYKILADNNDITAALKDRLLSLSITDEAGIQSDALTLKLDDRDGVIELPRKGAQLSVYIGYKETGLVKKGLFTVDEIEISGTPDTLTITAKAANMRDSLKSQKTRSWNNLSLNDIITTIAKDNQLTPKINPDLGKLIIPHLDQTAESDLHFITRIATLYGAVSKPVEDYLIFVPRGETKTATGKQLLDITINKTDVSNYRATLADRGKYQSVIAHWQATKTGIKTAVTIGKGTPAFTLRQNYPDSDTAKHAATAKLKTLNQGTDTISLTLNQGNPLLFAEASINLTGFRTGINGAWVSTRVSHQLNNSGYKTTMDAKIKGG